MHHSIVGYMHDADGYRVCPSRCLCPIDCPFNISSLQTAIGTALPVIVRDLQGEHFVWIGSAYTLGASALLPFCGGLAQVGALCFLVWSFLSGSFDGQVLGRRSVILGCLLLFSIGSALCGASTSMNFLIAGRSKHSCILSSGGMAANASFSCSRARPRRRRTHCVNSNHIGRSGPPSRAWYIQRIDGTVRLSFDTLVSLTDAGL